MNTNTKKEIWKPIPLGQGYYEASNLGRIRSFHKDPRGRIIQPVASPRGPLGFTMFIGGRRYSSTVARAVAEAFLGPQPAPNMEARHISTDYTDDRLVNIRWGTRHGGGRKS